MVQWFISFPEFAEFSESSAPFRKNSIIEVIVLAYKAGYVMKNEEDKQFNITES